MREDWVAYLRSIGFEEPLIDRTKRVLRFYTEIVRLDPTFLFVSEYLDKEDRPVFESMWFCDSDRAGEVKQFTGAYTLDCLSMKHKIVHWEAKTSDFDWISPEKNSRLLLDVTFSYPIVGKLRASGDNCMRLVEMLKDYIAPNLLK